MPEQQAKGRGGATGAGSGEQLPVGNASDGLALMVVALLPGRGPRHDPQYASLLLASHWARLKLPPTSPDEERLWAARRCLAELIAEHLRRRVACPRCKLSPDGDELRVLDLLMAWDASRGFSPRFTVEQCIILGEVKAARETGGIYVPQTAQARRLWVELAGRPDFAALVERSPYTTWRRQKAFSKNTYGEKRGEAAAQLALHFAEKEGTRRLRAALAAERAYREAGGRHPGDRSPHLAQQRRRRSTLQRTPAAPAPVVPVIPIAPVAPVAPRAPAPYVAEARPPRQVALPTPEQRAPSLAPASSAHTSAPTSVAPLALPRARQRTLLDVPRRLLVALLLTLALILGGDGVARMASLSLALADVNGWILVRQWLSGGLSPSFAIVNPRTGEWRELWSPADAAEVDNSTTAPNLVQAISPAYLPLTHTLAFAAKDSANVSSIWLLSLTFNADWPSAARLRQLVANCAACDTLAWSPTGHYLIFKGTDGLHALDVASGVERRITFNAGDAWPACAPSGDRLAYQSYLSDIVVVPAQDCIPTGAAASARRYVVGYVEAWHPRWSPDGRALTYATSLDSGSGGATVYAMDVAQLSTLRDSPRTPALKLSGNRCGDPIWATRTAAHMPVVVFGCGPDPSLPAPDNLLVIAAYGGQSSWTATLDDGPLNRDSLCWIPGQTK